jgi:beta-N-acetylhexosaminidase
MSDYTKKYGIILFTIAIALLMFYSPLNVSADDTFDSEIKKMTLRQKIGQLMFIGFQGRTLSSKDIAHIKNMNPGGIVFYARNFRDASEAAALTSKIKSSLKDLEVPVFFAIDQEGGIVHRIKGESYNPPSEPAIGATGSEELARKAGLSVGTALGSLGININLSPVLDVPIDISPSPMMGRSYSYDPETVKKLGIAYIKGLKDAGLLATAKHFPGIGRANEDSHFKLPHIIWKTQNEKDGDIMPFQEAVKAGVDIIMVGHFIAEPGDEKNPVSLSSYWMKNVLRKDIGFDGLIVVDNIEMKPIEEIMPVSEAAVQSFKAGADMIMVSHEREKQKAVFNALMEAAKKGDISQDRLDESLRRIISAKNRMTSHRINKVSAGDLNEISRLVAENSVIALRLKDATFYAINKDDKVLFAGCNLTLFNAIKDAFMHTEILNTTLANYKKIKPEIPIVEFVRKFDALIIDADYSDASEIISVCHDLNLKYAVVLSHPWNFQEILERSQPKWIIITYENSMIHLKTAIEIISGNITAKGRLPYKTGLPVNYRYSN